jgi:AraC family transcriptional regulator
MGEHVGAEIASKPARRRTTPVFSESDAWESVGPGWQHLHGSFRDLGYSIEWHDFVAEKNWDWSQSFHPEGVEICLNLSGAGAISAAAERLVLGPSTAGFYCQTKAGLQGDRKAGERHQFITVELSLAFLQKHLLRDEPGLHAGIAEFLSGKATTRVSEAMTLTNEHQQMIMSLRRPPVYAAARRMWYHAKALEVAAAFFYHPAVTEDLFCQRQKRQNQDRAQRVIALLKENLSGSLSLEEIGKRVGCSHFHLSRIFTQEMGKSIFQCLRELRLGRAAELLRAGRLSVTQVALEVGYSSPSHFSTAFHEAFGCCPGLYPLATHTQQAV